MKFKKIIFTVFLVLVFFIPLVSAFGVTSPYWDTKPLGLHPGESTEVQLLLQNMVGEKNMILKASITEGAEVATILDKDPTYSLPFGTKDVPVLVRVAIPEDASPEKTLSIKISFVQVANNDVEGKMLQMNAGVGAIIPVVVIPWVAPKKSSSTGAIVAVGVGLLLVAGVTAAVMVRKRRRKQN